MRPGGCIGEWRAGDRAWRTGEWGLAGGAHGARLAIPLPMPPMHCVPRHPRGHHHIHLGALLSPFPQMQVLNYGQAIFEGMKVRRGWDCVYGGQG